LNGVTLRALALFRLALLALVLCLLQALPARAEESVVAGLSQHSVSLTTGFSGSQLFVYGAVKRIAEDAADEAPLDIIITIKGPSGPIQVRKKVRTTGIWVNGRGVQIDEAPSFYAVASTGPIREILSHTDELRHRIGLDQVIRLIDAPTWVEDREEYRSAVARIRAAEGLYSIRPGTVNIVENTLFETRIELPADLTEGDYKARIFLLRDKQVLDVFADTIEVRRAGIGRLIYSSAREYPAMYGIVSILIALIAGWLASAFFRVFFPN